MFDAVEGLNWGQERGSLFAWADSGGRRWTGWTWWMETC